MDELHRQLISLLQDKEQAVPARINSVKDSIKWVADQLRQHPVDGSHLDAAFAYYVAGYYARTMDLISHETYDNRLHPAQRWLALLLVKQFGTIRDQVRSIAADEMYYDSTLQREIQHCGLADSVALDRVLARKLADILDDFMEFVRCGIDEKLDLIHSNLCICQYLACKAYEWRWWWWLECMRLVIDEFADNCLWTQLKPMRQESDADEMVSNYIVANYQRRSPIVELWRTQVESLPSINDPDRNSFCLSVPTSAGKTRVAELAILRFFLDYRDDPDAKCVYIAPLRRLAREVEETLKPAFARITPNRQLVSTFYGGHEIDVLEQEELGSSRVLVMTPEKLEGMIRHDRQLLSQIRLVIADEGHMIGERHTSGDKSYRGYKYRMLLERLVYMLRIKRVSTETSAPRLVFISGVLPNVEEFAGLITGDRKNVVSIKWSPRDEPRKAQWSWNGKTLDTSNHFLEPPSPVRRPERPSTNQFEEVVARTAFACARTSRTMVFSASKRAIMSPTLLEILQCLVEFDPLTDDPLPLKLPRRKDCETYYTLLEHGVAVHHADLPRELKEETEARIYAGRIRLLFASPTLAQGVNIPFDTLLVYRLQHWPGEPIQDANFWNVAGRVGRPIARSSGDQTKLCPPRVVFLLNHSSGASWEDGQDIWISTRLLSYEKQYRVATPFLEFLNELRKNWGHNTGEPDAKLLNRLAERPDLEWIENHRDRGELQSLLRLLDEHLTALIEESCPDLEQAADWLQDSAKAIVDLLVQATTIKPDELEFIKAALLARARFIAKNIPKFSKSRF